MSKILLATIIVVLVMLQLDIVIINLLDKKYNINVIPL